MSSSTEFSEHKQDNEDTEEELVPKNYYFIEQQISPKILEWQKFYRQQQEYDDLLKEVDEESNPELAQTLDKSLRESINAAAPLLEEIMDSVYKVIKGVIFRAQLHKREKYNTCFQIATEACIKSLPRFNPEEGTAFNYLSLTAKKSIIYYLIKKAKKKSLSLDYEYLDDENLQLKNLIKQENKSIKNLEIDNLADTIMNMIEIEEGGHKSLILVAKELRAYLFYNKGKYDKKDFFKWAKSDGVSSNLLRKFVKFLKEHKDDLYQEVGVY